MIFFGRRKAISAVTNRFPDADWIWSNHSRFSGYDSSPPDNSRRFNPFESYSVWKYLSYPFLSLTGGQKNPLCFSRVGILDHLLQYPVAIVEYTPNPSTVD
jgi:hypothetical protein